MIFFCWAPFWIDFGIILGFFLVPCLDRCWNHFGTLFDSMLDRFWCRLASQLGPQNRPKRVFSEATIDQKADLGPPSRPRDAKGRPEASREPFWSLLGAMVVAF